MVRITCCSLLRGAFSFICWLFILASFIVPMFIVGYLLLNVFSLPSDVVRQELTAEYTSSNCLCTRLWPDDFDYGVRVYASLESDAVSNMPKFLESAQLLWLVDSVSASKKYPKLASSAVVNVPDMLYSIDNRNTTLYAHIFIQTANNRLPYPNINDTSLVYTTTKLVYWRPVAKAANTTNNISPEYELVAATKVPWAIYLENYTYKCSSMPRFIVKADGSISRNSKTGYTYKPPVLNNTFTESFGKVKQLALLQSNGTLVSDFDSTTAVQFKLQGVWRGWIILREILDVFIESTNSTDAFVSVDSGPQQIIKIPRTTPNELEKYVYPILQTQSIVSLVTACVLFTFSLTMTFVSMKTWTAFWCGPKSKWDGVSRATFFIQYSSIFAECAKKYFTKSITPSYGIGLLFDLPCLLIMIGLPSNLLQWPGYITGKIALYKQASTHSSRGGADKDKPVQTITTIRRNVDSAALKWIRLVYLPIVVAVVLHALAYNTDGNWGVIKQAAEISYNILGWFCFVPQIILNHKARSGSLIPPTLYICNLCLTVIFFGCKYIIGLAEVGLPDTDDLIVTTSSIIFVIQWILYR